MDRGNVRRVNIGDVSRSGGWMYMWRRGKRVEIVV